MVVGITGNIGSGKSIFSKFLKIELEKKGFKINLINADKLGHKVLEENKIKRKLIKRWGNNIIDKNTLILKRDVIRKIVFFHKEEYTFLCSLVWPEILNKIKLLIKKDTINLLEAAVLIEAGWHTLCKKIVLIKSNFIRRFLRKKHLSLEEFIKINSFQASENMLEIYANYIVSNNFSLAYLRKQAKIVSEFLT